MNKKYYFDADCLSSFLAVSKLSIPFLVIDGSVIIPKEVYDEVIAAREEGFREQLESILKSKLAKVEEIKVFSKEGELYFKFHENPDEGFLPVGRGEAAAMALAISNDGVLVSNNLKDVMQYVRSKEISLLTTGMIIHEAIEQNVISKNEATEYWSEMIIHGCKLGAQTYEEYVDKELYRID